MQQAKSTASSNSSGSAAEERDDEIRQNVRKALERPQYDVTQLYHDTGVFQYIAKHPIFENLTLVVISLNAIWMAVDTDLNDAPVITAADPVFQVAENVFCMFFMFEWFCRFMAFRRKRDGLQDAWFVFDSMLVALMGLETWVMSIILLAAKSEGSSSILGDTSILRLFRLLRLSRMIRMLRSMPELMILVKGMMTAVKSVFFMMCLLVIIMYVHAIALTQLADGTVVGQDFFGSVSDSMFTLLFYGTFLDSPTIMWDRLASESTSCLFIYFFYSVLAALTILSMLIGVLCEVVSAVASNERDDLQAAFVTNQLQTIARNLDKDGNNEIDRDEFLQILEDNRAVFALEQVGVDPVGIVDFADFIFDSEDTLSFEDFMNMVLELRGSNFATKKDIVDLKKFVVHAVQQFEANLARCARTGKERKTKIALRGVSGSRSYRHDLNVSEGSVGTEFERAPTSTSAGSPDVSPTAAGLKDPPDLRFLPDPSPRSDTEWMRQELSELDRRTGGLEELLTAVVEEVKGLVEELFRKEDFDLPCLDDFATDVPSKPFVGIGGSSSPKTEILPGLHAVQSSIALESNRPLLESRGFSRAQSLRAGRQRLGAGLFSDERTPARSRPVSVPGSPKTRFACDFDSPEEPLDAATAALAAPLPPPPPSSPPPPQVLLAAQVHHASPQKEYQTASAAPGGFLPTMYPPSLPPLNGAAAASAEGVALWPPNQQQAVHNALQGLPGSLATPDRPPPIPESLLSPQSRHLPTRPRPSATTTTTTTTTTTKHRAPADPSSPISRAVDRPASLGPISVGTNQLPFELRGARDHLSGPSSLPPHPSNFGLRSCPPNIAEQGAWAEASAAPVPPFPAGRARALTLPTSSELAGRAATAAGGAEREAGDDYRRIDVEGGGTSSSSPGCARDEGEAAAAAARLADPRKATATTLTTAAAATATKGNSRLQHPDGGGQRFVPPALASTLEKAGEDQFAEGRSDRTGRRRPPP